MSMLSRRGFAALAAALAFSFAGASAHAQQLPVIRASSLTLPVFNPLVWNVMKVQGFDKKHGFELEAKPYPSISAFYAAFATGETDVLIGGPTVLQKLYYEGVPVRLVSTGFTLADLVVFTKNPQIKSLADLKGKQLAADLGSSQYQVIKIYANAKGIDLGKDITVVNANFAVARAQLEADRVDAALVIEPLASIILRAESGLEDHLQRRRRLEGADRRGRLGSGGGNARRCHPKESQGAADAGRGTQGHGGIHEQQHGGSRQDRQ